MILFRIFEESNLLSGNKRISKMMKRILTAIVALLTGAAPLFAGAPAEREKIEFDRHWFLQIQAGGAHTLGEAGFGELLSPAAALSAGYRFTPVWGLRFGLSGWQARGAWVSPRTVYTYDFVQGNADAVLDLANLLGRFNPFRTVNPYLFAGVGVSGAFNNDEANALNDGGCRLENIWSGSRAFVAGRLGAGVDFRLSDRVSLGLEVNASMLSDKFNSKKAGNVDWQFNALAGVNIRLGKGHVGRKAAASPAPVPVVPETPAPAASGEPAQAVPAPQPEPKPAAAAEEAAPLRKDIFFRIGSSEIRQTEQSKVRELADYLKARPAARVTVTGYADAATGSRARNFRLSQLRAEAVSAALQQSGVAPDRIEVGYRGDSEQPFPSVEKNRVSICIAR